MLAKGFLLAALWVILSGRFDAFHLSFGASAVALVLLFERRTARLREEGSVPAPRLRPFRLALYLLWLLGQIFVSAVHVARVVVDPRVPVRPTLVRFRTRQPGDAARVLLGNSITLTPGTLTVAVEGDEFVVHALSAKAAGNLLAGAMQARVARLFERPGDGGVHDARVEEP